MWKTSLGMLGVAGRNESNGLSANDRVRLRRPFNLWYFAHLDCFLDLFVLLSEHPSFDKFKICLSTRARSGAVLRGFVE